MKCGWCAPPGTTLARCNHFARNRFLDPNLVSYAKIEVAFGGFYLLDVSGVSLSDTRVIRSHGVISHGPGSAKTDTFVVAQGWTGIPRYDEKIGQGKVPTPGYVRQSSEKCLRRPPCPAGLVLVITGSAKYQPICADFQNSYKSFKDISMT